MNHIVITSINKPTEAVKKFSSLEDWDLVLVGDVKSPKFIDDGSYASLDIASQFQIGLSYPHKCRENSYARKNIGYLYAMMAGAEIIAESDDDNIPYEGWGDVDFENHLTTTYSGPTFLNVYRLWKDDIWPRGFPLQFINDNPIVRKSTLNAKIGVYQFLADLNPDVDAIYRMITPPRRYPQMAYWGLDHKIALGKYTYCPFNSQNTFWRKECFPLMYLPQTVNMRFSDILRGYVAQRIMWEENYLLGLGPATVYQVRNEHDLFQDFLDEIPMYKNVARVVEILESLELHGSFPEMLRTVYGQLSVEGIVETNELFAVDAWNEDIKEVM